MADELVRKDLGLVRPDEVIIPLEDRIANRLPYGIATSHPTLL